MADTAPQERKCSDPQVPKRKLSDTIPMESVQRLSKLPVVESSLNIATDVYSRVKVCKYILCILTNSCVIHNVSRRLAGVGAW
jgi:hypothetical protein